jgi:O-antigen/teichoic acid export membrane protein
MSTKRILTGEAFQLIANYVGGLLIGLIGTVLLTRALGPEDRGIYAWLLTLFTLGISAALLAQYNLVRKLGAERPESLWPSLVGPLVILNLLGCILAIPIFIWAFSQPLGQTHGPLLMLVMLGIPLMAMASVFSGFIHLRRQLWDTLGSSYLFRLTITGLLVLAWVWHVLSLPLAVFLGTLFAGMLMALIAYQWLGIPWRQWQWSFRILHGQGQFLGASWLAGLAIFAAPKVPLLLLPHYVSLTELGIFSLATTLLDIALLVPTAATSVLVSHFARSGHSTNGQNQALWALFALTAAMAVFSYVTAPYLLPWVFGPAFAAAAEPFRWLLLALLLQAPLATLSSAATARGQPLGVVLPPLLGLVATTALGLWLMPTHGLTGACWAIIAGYAMQWLVLAILQPRTRA